MWRPTARGLEGADRLRGSVQRSYLSWQPALAACTGSAWVHVRSLDGMRPDISPAHGAARCRPAFTDIWHRERYLHNVAGPVQVCCRPVQALPRGPRLVSLPWCLGALNVTFSATSCGVTRMLAAAVACTQHIHPAVSERLLRAAAQQLKASTISLDHIDGRAADAWWLCTLGEEA